MFSHSIEMQSVNLIKLADEVDAFYKKLDRCILALEQLSHLHLLNQVEPLKILVDDLNVIVHSLEALQKTVDEELSKELPKNLLLQANALSHRIQELHQMHRIIQSRCLRRQLPYDALCGAPSFLKGLIIGLI